MRTGCAQHLRSELSTRRPARRCRASKTSHGGRTAGVAALLGFALFAADSVLAAGIVVGFTNVQSVCSYSQSAMNDIAQFRWFFAHASVGVNMMSGLSDLNAASNSFYMLRSVSDDATPPTAGANGRVYDYNRGNPGWQAKSDGFRTCVSNGWRFPKVNLVLDKLCYIDQAADVSAYISSMTGLEAAFPETAFVYATMPLTTAADSNNNLRNSYNDTLRRWIRTHDRVLFDIADIEAHGTNGVEHTFVYGGRTNQMLCGELTYDGGHLNTLGRRQVALGFYAVCHALLDADRDRDGATDGEELIAGTRPDDVGSVFGFGGAATSGAGGGFVVSWPGTSNRVYHLQRITNLVSGVPFDLLTNAPATPPMNCHTDAPAGPGPFFYRLGVRQ